jgi:hypothetical protein
MKTISAGLFLFFFISFKGYSCSHSDEHLGEYKFKFTAVLPTDSKTLFQWLSDPSKVKQWLGNFETFKLASPPEKPFGVGYKRRIQYPLIGITEETITVYDFPHHIQYKVTQSNLMDTHLGDMCLSSIGPHKTQLTWAISFNSNFFFAKFSKFYLKMMLKRLEMKIKKVSR